MTTPQVSDSVIRKIQLLFQMAQRKVNNDGSSNEAEAIAAMAKAQELLAQHNLDLNVVQEARVEGGTAEALPEKRERTKFVRSAMYKWQQRLAKAICEANFCWYWTVDTVDDKQISGRSVRKFVRLRHVRRHVILGRVANAKVAEMMYEYLADTIERVIPYKGADRLSRSANSWREGCVDRLIERIEEKAERMKAPERKATEAAPSGVVAMTIRNVHEAEYAANYDAENGPGAYAKYLARQARLEKEGKQREKEAQEQQETKDELLRLERYAETPEGKAKREKREAAEEEKNRKANERYWKRQDQREERERQRRDVSAYYLGQDKAESIGLDSQIGSGAERKKLG